MMTDQKAVMALRWLKLMIDELSNLPPQTSISAYTFSRVAHIAFANGEVKIEGVEATASNKTVLQLALDSYMAVKAMCDKDDGPVLITWRCPPEIYHTGEGSVIYMRLAIEPDVWAN